MDNNNREDDANETSGKDWLTLLGSLVGESKLRIPKLEPDIIFSNMMRDPIPQYDASRIY